MEPQEPTVAVDPVLLRRISHEVDALRVQSRDDREVRESTSAKAWDAVGKLTQIVTLAIVGWVGALGLRVDENVTQLREYRATRFTAQNGLEMEARMISRDNPQLTLLVGELRAMAISFSERLARVETRIETVQASQAREEKNK